MSPSKEQCHFETVRVACQWMDRMENTTTDPTCIQNFPCVRFRRFCWTTMADGPPLIAGTLQTDPRSGGLKRSSGVHVLPEVATGECVHPSIHPYGSPRLSLSLSLSRFTLSVHTQRTTVQQQDKHALGISLQLCLAHEPALLCLKSIHNHHYYSQFQFGP